MPLQQIVFGHIFIEVKIFTPLAKPSPKENKEPYKIHESLNTNLRNDLMQ